MEQPNPQPAQDTPQEQQQSQSVEPQPSAVSATNDGSEGNTKGTGDAGLDARLAERLRDIEARTGKKCGTDFSGGKSSSLTTTGKGGKGASPARQADGDGAGTGGAPPKEPAANPGDDDDADTASGPGSDDERWLNEQLGIDDDDDEDDDENAVAPPVDPTERDIVDFFAQQETEYSSYAQQGLLVRGLCGACGLEVLSDMPRFKVNGVYYHEECRDAAVAMGVPCDPSLQKQAQQAQAQPSAGARGLNPNAVGWQPGGWSGGYSSAPPGGYSNAPSAPPQGMGGKGPPPGKGRGGGGMGFNLATY